MALLTSGVVLKLLDGMNSGVKPTGEYRNSLLQVTEIMPVDLDEKDLWPKQGFYVKLSDASHSIYVSLPSDLVFSNEIQLGQLVFVERLESGSGYGSPVPVAKGVKPVPGRQPFVKMPEPVIGFDVKGQVMNEKVDMNGDGFSNLNSNLDSKSVTRRRSSWGTIRKGENDVFASPKEGKPCGMKTDQCTPVKIRSAMNLKRNTNTNMKTNMKTTVSRRSSWVTGQKREHGINESPMTLKSMCFDHRSPVKKCASVMSYRSAQKMNSNRRESLSRLTETPVNKGVITSSVEKIPKDKYRITVKDSKTLTSPFGSGIGKGSVTPSSQYAKVVSSPLSSSKTSSSLNLPQNLSLLGKEAAQQQERAQKIALQALRNASATETLVCSLETLSTLTKSANPNDPTDTFDQFLDFHSQLVQAITNIVSVKAATKTTTKQLKSPSPPSQQKSTILRNPTRPLHSDQKGKMGISHGSLNDTIQLGNQIEREAGNWFMEFLEKCLEKGLKKSKSEGTKVPQLVLKKVMNWVEIEQCDSGKRPVHPKAVEIVRKLRIKLRNS